MLTHVGLIQLNDDNYQIVWPKYKGSNQFKLSAKEVNRLECEGILIKLRQDSDLNETLKNIMTINHIYSDNNNEKFDKILIALPTFYKNYLKKLEETILINKTLDLFADIFKTLYTIKITKENEILLKDLELVLMIPYYILNMNTERNSLNLPKYGLVKEFSDAIKDLVLEQDISIKCYFGTVVLKQKTLWNDFPNKLKKKKYLLCFCLLSEFMETVTFKKTSFGPSILLIFIIIKLLKPYKKRLDDIIGFLCKMINHNCVLSDEIFSLVDCFVPSINNMDELIQWLLSNKDRVIFLFDEYKQHQLT